MSSDVPHTAESDAGDWYCARCGVHRDAHNYESPSCVYDPEFRTASRAPTADPLHEWQDSHEAWAKSRLSGIPAEQLEWDRGEVEHDRLAYQAGLDIGLEAGYRMGRVMGNTTSVTTPEVSTPE